MISFFIEKENKYFMGKENKYFIGKEIKESPISWCSR